MPYPQEPDEKTPLQPGLRLGFAGTPEFAARILQALLAAGRVPAVVYTQPDRQAGRRRRLTAGPVKALAEQHGLPLRQPQSLRGTEEAAALEALDLDVFVVAAYGLILPSAVLSAPRVGCINVHASLLPRWRGAAPVERAIMAGDTVTGVSIMHMEQGLDTGPVYLQRRLAISADLDGPALETRLADLGAEALLECLNRLPDLRAQPQPTQGVTYAAKLTRADAAIDWTQPAVVIERQIRALRGRMPALTLAGSERLIVLAAQADASPAAEAAGTIVAAQPDGIRVACGQGKLTIVQAQLAGRRPASAAELLRGHGKHFAPGIVLATP
ncbi:MAG: methionyl-tRNA formyltransferase [Gammaproteobacteria bacterium]|nr:methionyl-tRNA formyltransferase [Gammaproteobacteria bacterium]